MTTATRKPSDVLRAAKERIGTPEKWCQGGTGCRGEQRCAGTAIYEGRVSIDASMDASLTARSYFRRANSLIDEAGRIPEWNDAPERTHAEVMAAFDKAIALAEADEQKAGAA